MGQKERTKSGLKDIHVLCIGIHMYVLNSYAFFAEYLLLDYYYAQKNCHNMHPRMTNKTR